MIIEKNSYGKKQSNTTLLRGPFHQIFSENYSKNRQAAKKYMINYTCDILG